MLSIKLCGSDKIMKVNENRACNAYGRFKKGINILVEKVKTRHIHEEEQTKMILTKVYFIRHGELR